MIKLNVVFFLLIIIISPKLHANEPTIWMPVNGAMRGLSSEEVMSHRYFRVDKEALTRKLSMFANDGYQGVEQTIEMPFPNGKVEQFSVESSSVMSPALAEKYPQIKTFKIRGVDEPHSSGRITLSHKGFKAVINASSGTHFLQPEGENTYKAFSRKSTRPSQAFRCGVMGHNPTTPLGLRQRPVNRTPGSLQVYRLAVATTAEYTAIVKSPGSILPSEIRADVLAAVVTAINRVNEIFERDLGIRLVLVGNTDDLFYTGTASSDPYTSTNDILMLDENQDNIDNVIGSANYDIGHLFTSSGGGIAEVASVCSNGRKAQGLTGSPNPINEEFYIDYVAHEIGHQFSAEHSFNGTSGGCGGFNRYQASAFEPGSGSTIMGYASICGVENISNQADAHFHAGSIDLVDTYTTLGNGSCHTLDTADNPSEPIANAGNDYNVPRQTPFVLTAQATDADIDTLTYNWYQMDAGTSTNSSTFGTDLGNNSLFRSYLPGEHNERHFPALGTTLQNKYDSSEVLACHTRQLNFRLTVRDGKSGMGQDDVAISVDNGSGPFEITSFNSAQSLTPGSYVMNWDVANTNQAPVNCSQVDISLLTFNSIKSSYSETVLAINQSNDGSTAIIIPDQSTTHARFKIQCSDNVFYDISDNDLTITGSIPFDTSTNTVLYNTDIVLTDTPVEVCIDEVEPEPDSGDSGAVGPIWLFSLLCLGMIRRRWKEVIEYFRDYNAL